jgi:hypothetical protein
VRFEWEKKVEKIDKEERKKRAEYALKKYKIEDGAEESID